MKRTQAITGLLIVVVLLVSLQTTIPVAYSEYGPSANGTKARDRVYVDTSDAYISASPHTLTADGYVYLNITSKKFGGNIDLCFGFNNSLAYPKTLEVFNLRNVTTSNEFNLTPFWDSPGCRVEYNSSKQIGTTVYDGYYWVYRNDTIFRDIPVNFTSKTSNETKLLKGKQPIGWNWTKIYSQHYDMGNLDTGMFCWNATETLNWTIVSGNLSSSKQAQSFLGMDKWYLGSVSFEQGKEYYLRVWLTVVPTLDDITHEFLVAFKPHAQSFQAASANGLFCYLDPWFNDGWTYRKSHSITAASGAGTDYQVWVVVHNYAGTDSGKDVFVSCRSDFGDIRFTGADGVTLLDYWIDSTADDDQLLNTLYTTAFWVKIPNDLSSTNQTIYVYYGNPNTCTTTSNGSATFEFFDDFSGSSLDSSKWGSISGGGSISVNNGELAIVKSSATYATYPTVYSLSSFNVLNLSFVARLYDWSYYDTIPVGFTVRNPLNNTPSTNRYSSALHMTNYYEEWECFFEDYYTYLDADGTACDYSNDLLYDQLLLRKDLRHSTSYNAWRYNGAPVGPYTAKSFGSSDTVYPLFGVTSNGQAGTGVYYEYVDWVLARKFVYPEPGHGTWGSAESIGGWYDSNWHYRKCHIIEPTEGAGTNYQVRINGHYLNGTDGGADVYFGGKCKGGFGDIRFTAMDGVTLLPYWMETPISDNATFWVKIPTNLNTTAAIIYMYYGNLAANSTSNGTATFDFFDDFTTDTGWSVTGNVSVSCGTLNLLPKSSEPKSYADKNRPAGYDNYRFRFRAATAANENAYYAYPRGNGSFWSNPKLTVGNYLYDPLSYVCFEAQGVNETSPILSPDRDEASHVLQVLKSQSLYNVTWDDTLSCSALDVTAETGTKIAFGSNLNASLQVEWVFMSKYWADPVHGAWGVEEGTGPAAPLPASFVVWGTQAYGSPENLTGGSEEKTDSAIVCEEILNYIARTGRFGYCSNYWGFDTQPSSLYDITHYYSYYYNDAWVFYKGHSIPTDCPFGWCSFPVHRAIYDSEGEFPASSDECIQDFRIFENQYNAGGFRHRLVFLWTCGYGRTNETGNIDWDFPAHSWGMMASWMGTTSLLPEAWNNTDQGGRCFISFDPYSAWFVMGTDYDNNNFGDFAAKFYQFLANGFSVTESLNLAAPFAFGPGENFASCKLNEGYPMPNPDDFGQTNVTSYMRVWGDGDITLPL